MRKRLSFWVLTLLLFSFRPAFAQDIPTSRKDVQIRVTDLPGTDAQRKQLSTVVGGKLYPIDRVLSAVGVARLGGYEANAGAPAWYLDPSGNYLYYTALTGCGFESDGMILFRSDLFGKKIEPILGRCDNLKMETLVLGEKKYLLVRESNSGVGETGFWVFDLASKDPLVHAAGTLTVNAATKALRYCNGNEEEPGACNEITVDTLLNRKSPVKLLPRFPLFARTAADDVELRQAEGSLACGLGPQTGSQKIPQKGSLVVVLDSCRQRGVYEVYYRGVRGSISRNGLTGFNVQ